MKQKQKYLLSILLTAILVFQMSGVSAFAEEFNQKNDVKTVALEGIFSEADEGTEGSTGNNEVNDKTDDNKNEEKDPEKEPAIPDGNPEKEPAIPDENPEKEPAIPDENPEKEPVIPDENPEKEPAAPDENPEKDPAAPDEDPEKDPAIPEKDPEKEPTIPNGIPEEEKTAFATTLGLTNIAAQCTMSVEAEESGKGKENLVDGSTDTLWVKDGGGWPSTIEITLPANSTAKVKKIVAKPESGAAARSMNFTLSYKNSEGTTNLAPQTITFDSQFEYEFPASEQLDAIALSLDNPIDNGSAGQFWPTLSEIEVWVEEVAPTEDTENLAWKKPVHANYNGDTAYLVNDGNKSSTWTAEMYPAYVDIDLEKNYDINEIQIYTPETGYIQYSIFTSMDGRDFDLVAEKTTKDSCPATGESYSLNNVTARIVRVYLEYNSSSSNAPLSEARVLGTENATEPVQGLPAIDVVNFENTAFDVAITNADRIAEVQGIIERNVGAAYKNWFTFEIVSAPNGYDYFTLSDEGGKIKVTGNNGVSLATGLNHYLKYFCNVNISQVGSQVKMPPSVIPVGTPVHKETKYPIRYAYNYKAHSYSMAFWGETEWRKELDWLALNGVNVVFDITGQEEVWRRFLMKIGYTHQEAKDFIAGPAYYAWSYMANLTSYGGPVHDSWLEERTELARKNQLIMRKLGMEVVLQAYNGMVPVDLAAKNPDVAGDIIAQSAWLSFRRPSMLRTDSAAYDAYASKFYEAQKETFGNDAKYFAADPFCEDGDTGGMSMETVGNELLNSLLDYNSNAVWVIQSWKKNPTSALLKGLRDPQDRRQHAIVLDLYAEKAPNWNSCGEDTDGDSLKEFSDTPWVYCQLNNFGGRMGLHGHLDNLAAQIPAAANSAKHMSGIGIAPEAGQNNPLLYDFLFETIWTDDATQPLAAIDMDTWLAQYAHRRYGAESGNAERALKILSETVYKASLNMKGEGAPESVVNARPDLHVKSASSWGNAEIDYKKDDLKYAAYLLLKDYDTLSGSDAYLYDLADILKQVLSNTAQDIQIKMSEVFRNGDLSAFNDTSNKFLDSIDLLEQILGSRKEFLFGTWTTNASNLAVNADDFAKRVYLFNAKALVTTWGSYQQCESSGLKDYSNRQWAGLTNDYYKYRWQAWIDEREKQLSGKDFNSSINWFELEFAFARDPKAYTNQPNGADLKTLGETVLKDYSPEDSPTDEFDIDYKTTTVTVGNDGSIDLPKYAVDNNPDTIWHTDWGNAVPLEDRWITVNLGSSKIVNGFRYLPRSSGINGIVKEYTIEVSLDGKNFTQVASGTWPTNYKWKIASFDAVEAQYVRLNGITTVGDKVDTYMSAAEVRVTVPKSIQDAVVTLPQAEYTYTGKAIEPVPKVKLNGITLAETTDYTVSYENNIEEGQASVIVTGVNDYTGTVTATFDIVKNSGKPTSIADAVVTLPQTEYTYTGKAIEPAPTVKLNGVTLAETTDYSVSYKNNIEEGQASVIVTGVNDYTGTVTAAFDIVKNSEQPPISIANAVVTLPQTQYTYTGKAIEPAPTVKLNGVTLAETTDYTVSYKNNTEEGQASVIVTGVNNYTGTVAAAFDIVKNSEQPPISIANAVVTLPQTQYTYTGKAIEPQPQIKFGNVILTKGIDYEVSYQNNVRVGTATIVITGIGGYKDATNITFKIIQKDSNNSGSSGGNSSGGNNHTTPDAPDTITETTNQNGTTVTTTIDERTGQTTTTIVAEDGIKVEIVSKEDKVTTVVTIPDSAIKENDTVKAPMEDVKVGKDKNSASSISIFLPETGETTNVEIPIENLTSGTVAIIVHEDGTEEIVKQSIAKGGGLLVVPMNCSATIKIVDNSKSFEDVNENHWAAASIAYVTSREILYGISETIFAPNEPMKRSMMVSVLHRIEGEPKTGKNIFDDVPKGMYYTDAVAWAVKAGVVSGVGNGFNPDGNVTREQIAVMLYHYAGKPSVSGDLEKFSDKGDVSDWAYDAMVWAVNQGIISGTDADKISPTADATRVQVAAMIERFMKNVKYTKSSIFKNPGLCQMVGWD